MFMGVLSLLISFNELLCENRNENKSSIILSETRMLSAWELAMTDLNIDNQPLAVKQFFETLALTPEGSVVTMNGKLIGQFHPAGTRDSEWNEAKSARRYELIDRDLVGTITQEESLELELLQSELRDHVERTSPLPIDYARKLYRELLAKANAEVTSVP